MALARVACSAHVGSGLLAARGGFHTHISWSVRAGDTGLGIPVWGCWGPDRRLAELAIAWVTYSRGILSFHLSPFTPYC